MVTKNRLIQILPYFAIIVLTLILLVPMFFTPLIFDEHVYFYYAWLLKTGDKLYFNGWFDDKGPLIYLIYLVSMIVKSNYINVIFLKLFTLIWQCFTVVLFYKFSSKIFYKNSRFSNFLVTIVFAILYLGTVFEGQYSNADNFILLPIIISAIFFMQRKYYLSSFFIGLSFLIKQNTALIVLSFVIIIFQENLTNFKYLIRTYLKMFLYFIAPTLVILIYTWFLGTSLTFLNNFLLDRLQSHITVFNTGYFQRYFLSIFKQNYIFFVLALLNTISILFSKTDSKRSFINAWLLVSILSVLPGGNFFPHYFIVMLPALVLSSCMSIGNLFNKNFNAALLILVFVAVFGQNITIIDQLELLSHDKHAFESSYDMLVKQTVNYLGTVNAKNIFVYDYNPSIYIYSQLKPVFNYPFKFLYIDYTKVSPVAIYETIFGIKERQTLLASIVNKNQIDRIIVSSFGVSSDQEIDQLVFLYDILKNYEVEKTFDKIWVYKRSNSPADVSIPNYSLNSFKIEKDDLVVEISRLAKLPDAYATLKCGDDKWYFPENGIQYPMHAKQNSEKLILIARKRSDVTKECDVVIRNMSGQTWENRFKFN